MKSLSESTFEEKFDFAEIEQTVVATVRLAANNPTALNLFFQRYLYFNGYASSVIARLASSIAMSRYLFNDPNEVVIDDADRGFQISAEVMIAASDEGAYEITHRELAQLLQKTIANYAGVSIAERNQLCQIPQWLEEIVQSVLVGYPGVPGDAAALIRAVGFHAASEMLGDREYALIDRIIRYENKGIGFDRYLREETSPVRIREHRYDPWCYVLIHGKHEGSGAEAKHFIHVLQALEMMIACRPEPRAQIEQWIFEGYESFVALQQRLFQGIYRECLELGHVSETVDFATV